MKAVQFFEHGESHVLTYITDSQKPVLARGEVLIRNHATSLNRIDQVARIGYPGIPVKLPHILGGDVCGEIAELGDDAGELKLGQRVSVYPLVWCDDCPLCQQEDTNLCLNWQYIGLHRNGGYAEYVAVPARNCIALPDNISDEEGAAIPVAGITAFHGLKTVGELKTDQVFFNVGGSRWSRNLGNSNRQTTRSYRYCHRRQ